MKNILAVVVAAFMLSGLAAERKIAVFVQNRTKVAIDANAVRDRFVAGLAGVEGFTVVDATLADDAFKTSPNVAAQLGVDYVAVIGIIGASPMARNIGGHPSTVYTLRVATKITDSNAKSVSGLQPWVRQLPVLDATGDAMSYYDMLLDQWAQETVATIARISATWREPSASAAGVPFWISTTVDRPIAEYESQTKGLSGERLAELRKVAGGATVEIDGIAVGTSPCEVMTTPGLHKLRITREWMAPYEKTISVSANGRMEIAMELSEAGIAKWGTLEKLQADVAQRYAKAALDRGTKINIDTSKWRDAAIGSGVQTLKITD